MRRDFLLATAFFVLAGAAQAELPPAPKPVTVAVTVTDGATATSDPVDLTALGGDQAFLLVELVSTTGAVIEVDVNHEISYSKNPDSGDWYTPATPLLLDINAAAAGDFASDLMTDVPPFMRFSVDASPAANDGDVVMNLHVNPSHRRDDNGLGRVVKAPRASGQLAGSAVAAGGSTTLLDGAGPFGASDADSVYLMLDLAGQDGDEVLTLQGAVDGDGPWLDLASTTVSALRTRLSASAVGLVRFRATLTNPAGADVTPSHAFVAY